MFCQDLCIGLRTEMKIGIFTFLRMDLQKCVTRLCKHFVIDFYLYVRFIGGSNMYVDN